MDNVFVHDTASVEEGASVGAGTKIWNHAQVRGGARIGERVIIGKNVFVDADAVVGNGVKIQNNVSVYSGVHIDDDVFVGPSAVFTNDRFPRAFDPEWERTDTYLRRGCSIGANATLVCGVTIGEFATVASGAVVTKSVEPFELVAGNPARRLGWVCACGRVLARTSGPLPTNTTCDHCGRTAGEPA